jgi:hypothetical protein
MLVAIVGHIPTAPLKHKGRVGDDPLGISRADGAGKVFFLESTLPLFKDVAAVFTAVLINRHCPTPLCVR